MLEINSYTSYYDKKGTKTVAVVDKDSVPSNAKVGDKDTYEDDVDRAPSLQLVKNNSARKIDGNVFEDVTEDILMTGQIREGDGKFVKAKDKVIKGMTVTLSEINGSIPPRTIQTKADGSYSFESFIPGQYIVTYTWGDSTYTVQNYKGTVYQTDRNQKDKYWYRVDKDTRYSDALDDYEQRYTIDKRMQDMEFDANTLVNNAYKGKQPQGKAEIPTKIDSYTPEMSISVEYDTNPTSGNLVMMNFDIKNIDFGIVLRPKQQIDLNKSVSKFKITLSNGQPLIDAVVESNGKLSGQTDYLTYMGPKITGVGENGYIKAEMDSEIIQGATMEVVYEIKAMNHSEIDYMTKGFYHYGKARIPADIQSKVVTLVPDTVIDYLDKDFVFNPEDPQNKLYEWKVVTKADLVNYLKEEEVTFFNDNHLSNHHSNDEFLNERMILLSRAMKNTHLKPEDTASIYLYASKQLSTVEDISLDNDAHIVRVRKPTPPTQQTGGNIPYFPDNPGETIIVIPSTGADRNYAIWIGIGVISLLILGGGIYFIKKRIMDKE